MPLAFAPDLDADQPGNIQAASGIRPTLRGYAPFATLAQYNGSSGWGALTTAPNNMWGHHWSVNGRIIASSTTKLYELSLTSTGTFTVTDVSVGAGSYTAPSYTGTDDEQDPLPWCFASVGDVIYASNKFTSTMQKQSAKAAAFTSVTSSPCCSCMVAFKNFLFIGNTGTYGGVTGTRDMVAWSGIGNTDVWVPSQATQAGYQRLLDVPGRIVALKPMGEYLAIYKQNAIWFARYDGTPVIWTFNLVEQNIGVNSDYRFPPPLVDIGNNTHVFVGAEDIYAFNGSGEPQSITIGTVRRYLRQNYFDQAAGRMPGTRISHDVQTGDIIFWSYGLVYNHWFKKWGALPTGEIAVPIASCESNLPGIGGGAPGVINDPGYLIAKSDKRIYNRYNYSFDATARTFEPMNIQCEGGNNGQATTLLRVIPKFSVVPAGTCTLSYYRRAAYGGTAVADSTFTWDATNYRFDGVRNAYWHRTDISIVSSASTSELSDVEYSVTAAGKRVEFPLIGSRG